MVGQEGEVLRSTSGPHMGQNRNAFPYGLPPNYTQPNAMHMPNENASHIVPVPFERQQPQPIGDTREEPRDHAQVTLNHTLRLPLRDQRIVVCLSLMPQGLLNITRCNPCISR